MLLRGLIILMWLICIAVAMVATFMSAIAMPGYSWWGAAFWWAVVVLTFRYDHKHKAEVK